MYEAKDYTSHITIAKLYYSDITELISKAKEFQAEEMEEMRVDDKELTKIDTFSLIKQFYTVKKYKLSNN